MELAGGTRCPERAPIAECAAAGVREGTSTVHLHAGDNCERARVNEQLEYFVAEHARTPFALTAGQELWVEVTVPMFGPSRLSSLRPQL